MVRTKKKEVQTQGLRPSQKAKAEKLRKKQEAKIKAKQKAVVVQENASEIPEVQAIVETPQTADNTSNVDNKTSVKVINVKNAEGDPDTVAEILVQNKIDYTPKVSVVVPVYNVEPYLRQCLDSVLNQTLKEIEIICVDDGSTDASLDILKEYAAKDNRITVITQKNLYAGVARNAGLSQAKGEYLSFLDSDDFFELNMLEEMYSKAIQYEADFCICHVKMYNMSKETLENCLWGLRDEYLPQKPVFSAKDIYDKIYQANQGWVWDKIYSRDFVLKNGIKFQASRSSNDVYFNFCHLTIATKIVIVDDFLMTHRLHVKGSLENTREKSYNNIYNAIKKIQHYLIVNNLYNKVKISFVNYAISNITWNYDTLKEPSKTFLLEVIHEFYEELFYSINKKDYFKPKLYEKFKNILKQQYIKNPKEYIPVVFATNKNYCLPCVVTIKSLIKHASKKRKYAIFVLHSELDENDIRSLEDLNTKNVFVHCMTVDVEKLVGDSFEYTRAHYSKEMYYRILIPQLFGIYEKVVYLDCDIVLMKDVYDLYNTDIGDNAVGAVINPIISSKSYVLDVLNLKCENYFNSGILVINNQQFKALDIKNKCIDLLNAGIQYKYPDQDVLNIACSGHIFYLDVKWNYQWFFRIENIPLPLYCREGYEKAENDPYIIHYASGKKPWNFDDKKFTKEWRKYYRKIRTTASLESLEERLKQWYFIQTKKVLDLDNPKTFNEKIQWLKIYEATPIKTLLADKYLVRDWVKEKIGEQYLIPLLGAYDSFEEINFDELPEQFVIKCNHGSGYNIIVKNKYEINPEEIKSKLDKWMNENFAFKMGIELQYKNMKPKIIIEKMIKNLNAEDLNDYKFYCFDGKVKYVQVISERINGTHKVSFYDMNWEKQPWWDNDFYEGYVEKPQKFDEMVKLAQKMCQGFSFVRVDLYYLDTNEIYFGEMTFSPSSGGMRWSSEKINLELGNMIKLPKIAYDLDSGTYYKYRKKSRIIRYITFPYYLWKIGFLKNKLKSASINMIMSRLTATHINVKNIGSSANSVIIEDSDLDISSPSWLINNDGQGKFATGSQLKQFMRIIVVKEGTLSLSFKGRFHTYNGKHLPVWIDYKSIKINGKEILLTPIATWHDKPYNYKMHVEDRQEIILEIEQQYHQYTEDELREFLLKINGNSNYIKENMDDIMAELKSKLPIIDAVTYAKQKYNSFIAELMSRLTATHINVKNIGSSANSVIIEDSNVDISSPSWLINNDGQGKFATGSQLKQFMKIIVVKEGTLSLSFKGRFHTYNGKHLPVWIDYKSIKINGKEILLTPIATWHDKPYNYKMHVEDGQEIILEIEQQYHQYTEDELRDILFKLNIDNSYFTENVQMIISEISEKIKVNSLNNKENVA